MCVLSGACHVNAVCGHHACEHDVWSALWECAGVSTPAAGVRSHAAGAAWGPACGSVRQACGCGVVGAGGDRAAQLAGRACQRAAPALAAPMNLHGCFAALLRPCCALSLPLRTLVPSGLTLPFSSSHAL
eukprot:359613-Chlamydomonas_euryale.AAC.3